VALHQKRLRPIPTRHVHIMSRHVPHPQAVLLHSRKVVMVQVVIKASAGSPRPRPGGIAATRATPVPNATGVLFLREATSQQLVPAAHPDDQAMCPSTPHSSSVLYTPAAGGVGGSQGVAASHKIASLTTGVSRPVAAASRPPPTLLLRQHLAAHLQHNQQPSLKLHKVDRKPTNQQHMCALLLMCCGADTLQCSTNLLRTSPSFQAPCTKVCSFLQTLPSPTCVNRPA
jgi:hypothetical protein